ncbi:Amino acid permease family protein [Tritrichomonas foetus]|uniref:Amino acid permease family protein n=1 Tax=Tritrichomonas foetus TaxID=1144522 RepID=A0A1J4KDT8_9EUKA|nr:Amino acid permease family protein [Tritrichomonas foetus]|eukprot:OHT09601.1 Amino acid permease family protein [Tritrichomonas foetus]
MRRKSDQFELDNIVEPDTRLGVHIDTDMLHDHETKAQAYQRSPKSTSKNSNQLEQPLNPDSQADPNYSEKVSLRKLNENNNLDNDVDYEAQDSIMVKATLSNSKKVTFHWFIGVFIPTIINVICVTYFMDLHRSINHIGWGLGFLYYTFSIVASIGTLVSICVIATNGEMKDGGCYYLISRTLGPEIGGVIGVTLLIAHASALSHRLQYISATITNFYSGNVTISQRWDRTLWHLILSFVVLGICLPGIRFVLAVLPCLAILLIASLFSIFLGFFVRRAGNPSFFTGLSLQTLTDNFKPGVYSLWEYFQFLGVLFPSANAVMTCANFSGNLRPVGRAIPLGGFSAMFLASVIICGTFLLIAGSFKFYETESDVDYLSFDASLSPFITYIGFIATCLGSAITLSTGGSNILAKMIEDLLMPQFLRTLFFKGEPFGCNVVMFVIANIFALIDNPTTSTQITNIVYSIPFALVNFAVWNAESAHYPGFRPSFRFYNKWTALLLAAFCFVRMFLMNWIMALSSLPIYFIIWSIYHYYVKPADTWGTVTQSRIFYATLKEELSLYHIKPHVKTYRPNVILITTQHPDDERTHIDFLNQLLHGHGMAAIGRVFVTDLQIDFATLVEERDGTYLTDETGYQTFYDVTASETFADGVRDLLLLMGIGMMRPNTICLSFPEGWLQTAIANINNASSTTTSTTNFENNNENTNEANNGLNKSENVNNGMNNDLVMSGKSRTEIEYDDFVNAISMAFDANFSLTVLRNIEYYSDVDRKGYIDVWWLTDDGGLSLLLPYLLSQHKTWKKSHLRLITIANRDEGNTYEKQHTKIATLLYKFRIKAEPVVIETSINDEVPTPMAQTQWNKMVDELQLQMDKESSIMTHKYLIVSDLVREYSSGSSFVALTMMVPRDTIDQKLFMAWLEVLSGIKVPFCFVRGNGENTLSWTV